MAMEVTLRRVDFKLDRREVEDILSEAQESGKASYYVIVKGKEIPVKRALEKVLRAKGIGLTLLDYTTQDAVRIFRRLGFDVVRRGKSDIMRFAGAIRGNGNSVEDKEKIYEGSP
ncbi:hypothetical protein HG1285_02318 [Hydrogenivirga sp. 128-5-R1-1]|nr:hypothetical protein HG1285_02318 [Hydrogenivirga sp. 128-5-R1-1]